MPRTDARRRSRLALAVALCLALALLSCGDVQELRPPLVLITLEGNGDPSSARALELLEKYEFDRSWQAVASSANVVAALGALHTGLRPWQHGAVNGATSLHPGCETLAVTLKALGYETAAFADRAARLERLGFARGYLRYGALRSGKRALADLESLEPGRFVWLHLRFDEQRDLERQWRRLASALEAAARSPAWRQTSVAIVGVTGANAQGLHHGALSVPIHLRSPGTVFPGVLPQAPVAAARLYETLNALAGGEPLPATAASLLLPDASVPLFSSVHGRGKRPGAPHTNVFSLVEGERQLLRRVEVPAGTEALPFTGNGRPRFELRRFTQPTVVLDEPAVREGMAERLRRAWMADLAGEEPMRWRPLEPGTR